MGLKNFSRDDLRSSNLPELVRQLKEAVSNKEYKTIEDFARAFATEMQSSTVLVDQRDGSGKRMLNVNGEEVDISGSVSAIMAEIDRTRTFAETDPAKVVAYEKMYSAVDSQLTALFMQDKMMEELAGRGFDAAAFADQAVEANKRSDAKIAALDSEIKKYKGIESKILEPKDELLPDGSLRKVTLKTRIKDEEDAKVYLEGLKKDIAELKSLEAAIQTMEAQVTADPSKESMYRGKIDASKTRVSELTGNMNGKVQSIKDLNLKGFNFASIEHCTDSTKMSRDAAETAITTLESGMDARIVTAYKNLAKNLTDAKKAGKDTFEPAEIAAINKINSSNPAEVEAAKKAIEAAMAKVGKAIETNTKFKKQEEALKIARTKSTAEYQRVIQRKQQLEVKFEEIQEVDYDGDPVFIDAAGNLTKAATDPSTGLPNQKKLKEEKVYDSDGNLLYIDASGNVTKSPIDPTTGNPNAVYISTDIPKAATRQQYLADAGFDKTAKTNTIKSQKESDIKSLSWMDRRDLLKKYDVGNPFSRFFMSKRLMNSEIKLLAAGEASTELAALDAEEAKIVAKAASAERIELDDVIIATDNANRIYAQTTRAAALQREMANGAYGNNDVLRNRNVNTAVVDSMRDAALEQTSLIMARTLLAGKDLSAYEEAMQRYTFKQVTREHNDQKGIANNAQNPQHEDITR